MKIFDSHKIRFLIFTTEICPRCPAVKTVIQEFISSYPHFHAEFISADSEDGLKKAQIHGVLAVPTVIVMDSNDKELLRVHSDWELKDILKAS